MAALVSRGYICIAPNVRDRRGTEGIFNEPITQDLGGGDLQDEVYATKFLQATGYVDAKKIGITGGSYGGFMTLMAIAKTPDIWAASVELFGIIDWMTMLQHSDTPTRSCSSMRRVSWETRQEKTVRLWTHIITRTKAMVLKKGKTN